MFDRRTTIFAAALLALATMPAAFGNDDTRYSIDASAGVSAGGGYELHGCIGQFDAVAPPPSGGPYTMTGGFLAPVPASVCTADLDASGHVGFNDLSLLLGSWGPCPSEPPGCPADLDVSGHVGFDDLTLLLGTWGSCHADV